MAQEPKDPGTGTNALLAQILEVAKQQLDATQKQLILDASVADSTTKMLAGIASLALAAQDAAKAYAALLKVETDSREYLKQIRDALLGNGGEHVYTVLVQQIAEKVASKLKH